MSKLLAFFKSKNIERKFSRLGDGHRLGEPSSSESPVESQPYVPPVRAKAEPSEGALKAAEAAMERMNRQTKPDKSLKNEVKRELEQVKRAEREAEELRERFTQKVVTVEKPMVLSKVLFWCPELFGNSVIGSRDEVDRAINDYLVSESSANLSEAATLMLIRGLESCRPPIMPDVPISEQPTASEWREKRKQNFARILNNLIQTPDNPTFRRLRVGNQLVRDLMAVEGAELFFVACNFTTQSLRPPTSDSASPAEEEPYLVITEEAAREAQHLQRMLELLNTAEPIMPELYRDTKVFHVSGTTPAMLSRDHLPDDFFYQTKEEAKRSLEQQQRIIEESGMLMTKAMRERLRVQEVRLFRYALIRVRLPGNIMIQGTFCASDNLGKLRSWITDCLADPTTEYQLWAPPGTISAIRSNVPPTARAELTNNAATLTELGLAPCSVLNLSVSSSSTTLIQLPELLRQDLLSNASTL
ncbi:UBX domain-containing protein 6 [Clonorchis sinensis]|uniref:UBX domain-containing protein 6 n=1 Tax=Clonorchis sinensis TaxID=79923 RepID=A0A419QFD1_CLOSI|nr:UBX domain-containing protein 6 [Clonorchis sinensis]